MQYFYIVGDDLTLPHQLIEWGATKHQDRTYRLYRQTRTGTLSFYKQLLPFEGSDFDIDVTR